MKDKVKNLLESIVLKNGIKLSDTISEVISDDEKINFVIYVEDPEEGKEIKSRAAFILHEEYPKHSISIAISNPMLENKIKKIVLVSSGKGGVGKSTIASYIAQRLASKEYKVGLLDADIYGSSIPTIFGVANRKPEIREKMMLPIVAHGVKIMSMGFFIDSENSIPWRGPMISKAIQQLISQTYWGYIDYLIVDMPPGTGDIHLTLLQNYKVSCAVVVTMQQLLSIQEAVKVVDLYKKFNIGIHSIVYNMIRENSNEESLTHNLFNKYNINKHYKVKFDQIISEFCDLGKPLANIINIGLDVEDF